MLNRLRGSAFFALLTAALLAGWASSTLTSALAAPAASPTPTPVPTPFMELAMIPNGTWQIIIEDKDISYSKMTLKVAADGTTINGTWGPDKHTNYVVSGVRDGAHLKLDVKSSAAADAQVLGKIDATLDGIADMFGTITLNGVEKPFQGAQHTRVPPPVDASPNPGGAPGVPGGGTSPSYPGQPGYPH